MAAKRDRAAAAPAVSSPRKTRSATSGKRAAAPPPLKKAKVATATATAAPVKGKGKSKVAFAADKVKNEVAAAAVKGSGKTIIIEACKQCSSFKKRADEVKDGLESAVVGIIVVINPEKPRRGCFEIRESDGEVFISLLGMPRPFTPMKKLDMDQVVADIVKKVA